MQPAPRPPMLEVVAICAVCGYAHTAHLTPDQWAGHAAGESLGTCRLCKLPLTPEFVRHARAKYITQETPSE